MSDMGTVRAAVRAGLRIHPRLVDQGLGLDDAQRVAVAEALPELKSFEGKGYAHVVPVLDWDHRIPCQIVVLRLFCVYDDDGLEQLESQLRARNAQIDDHNRFPEFDVPDYGEISVGEVYAVVLQPGGTSSNDIRFLSDWRTKVAQPVAAAALTAVKKHKRYKQTKTQRGSVVVGWAPPCIARSEGWAIEVWLLTRFDGHSGTALVFMVDAKSRDITRIYSASVQLG